MTETTALPRRRGFLERPDGRLYGKATASIAGEDAAIHRQP